MTDPGENDDKINSRDPKKIATTMLILIAIIMLVLLVKNCVTDRSEKPSSDSKSAEIKANTGYADQSEYLIDYTGK